jgi:ankyrin repeat protein
VNAFHNGTTPLLVAAQSGQTDVCRFLINHGANPNPKHALGETPLYAAVKTGNKDIVVLLLPICNAQEDFLSFEAAISTGFHEIADLMLESGIFKYPQKGIKPSLSHSTKLSNGPNVVAQWQKFLSGGHGRLVALDQLQLEYAFVLGCKAGEAGLQTMELILNVDNFDINCRVRIGSSVMAPLTAAAELSHFKIIRYLLEQPRIDVTVCGEYNWPPFLHLLRSIRSVSTPHGVTLLDALWAEPLVQGSKIFQSATSGPFEVVFENVLQSESTNSLIGKVIDIVHGAAGGKIIPLLIRCHRPQDQQGLRWLLCLDNFEYHLENSWVRICEYLEANEDLEALELFIEAAEGHVEWKKWSIALPMCLSSRNFRFAKQFFFELWDKSLSNLTHDSLRGYNAAARSDKLIEAWDASGYANAALWNAVQTGIWQDSPDFEKILSDARINPNRGCSLTELVKIDRKFIDQAYNPSESTAAFHPKRRRHTLQDYQIQLMLLEQQNRTAPFASRGQEAAYARQTAEDGGRVSRSILTWAAEVGDLSLAVAAMQNPRIAVNIQDLQGNTCFMYAVSRGDRDMIAQLLERKDLLLNTRDDRGRSAIFHAVQNGWVDIVDTLIRTNKVDMSIRDENNWTVMDYAKDDAKKGNDEILSMLQAERAIF